MIDLQLYTSAKVTNLESKSSAESIHAITSIRSTISLRRGDECSLHEQPVQAPLQHGLEPGARRAAHSELLLELRRHSISLE